MHSRTSSASPRISLVFSALDRLGVRAVLMNTVTGRSAEAIDQGNSLEAL